MSPKHSSSNRAKTQAWTAAEDALLKTARRQGANWSLASRNFPGKTSNACRKRHERLMEQERRNEFDNGLRAEQLAAAYMRNREAMWRLVAAEMGERWEVVEAKCFEKGFRNLRADSGKDSFDLPGSSSLLSNSPDSGIGLSETDYRHPSDLWNPPATDCRGHLMPPVQHYGPPQPQPHQQHQAYYSSQHVSPVQPAYRTQVVTPRSQHHEHRSAAAAPRGPPSIPSMLSAPSQHAGSHHGRWASPRR